MKQRGFGLVGVLVIVLVLAVVGGAGWYVWSQGQEEEAVSLETTVDNVEPLSEESTKEIEDVSEEMKIYTSFEVIGGPSESRGSCDDGEVLFGVIYNSESTKYTCKGPDDAGQYANIIFGESGNQIYQLLDSETTSPTESTVKINQEVLATKYEFEGKRKVGGFENDVRYTVYEVPSENGIFYALHWTGIGFGDENMHLELFNELVQSNWVIN